MVKVATEYWYDVWDALSLSMGLLSQDLDYLLEKPSPTEKDCEEIIHLTHELERLQRELHKKYKRYFDACAKREEKEEIRLARQRYVRISPDDLLEMFNQEPRSAQIIMGKKEKKKKK